MRQVLFFVSKLSQYSIETNLFCREQRVINECILMVKWSTDCGWRANNREPWRTHVGRL